MNDFLYLSNIEDEEQRINTFATAVVAVATPVICYAASRMFAAYKQEQARKEQLEREAQAKKQQLEQEKRDAEAKEHREKLELEFALLNYL